MSTEPVETQAEPDVTLESKAEHSETLIDVVPPKPLRTAKAAKVAPAKAAIDPADRTYRVLCSMLGAHRGVMGADGQFVMTDGGFVKGEVFKAGQLGPGVDIQRLIDLGSIAPCEPDAVSAVEAG